MIINRENAVCHHCREDHCDSPKMTFDAGESWAHLECIEWAVEGRRRIVAEFMSKVRRESVIRRSRARFIDNCRKNMEPPKNP